MKSDYLVQRPRRAGLVLLAVGGLHLLAVWLWTLTAPAPPSHPDQRRMVWLQLPAPVALKARKPAPPARALRARRDQAALPTIRTRPMPATPATPAPQPASEVRLLPADPFAADVSEAASPLAQAKQDAVRFDKEVNKDRLKGITSFENRPFALALGGAFKATGTTLTEYRSADGRAITKVTGRGGSYCVMALESHSVMSETLGRQGATTRKVKCPE